MLTQEEMVNRFRSNVLNLTVIILKVKRNMIRNCNGILYSSFEIYCTKEANMRELVPRVRTVVSQ